MERRGFLKLMAVSPLAGVFSSIPVSKEIVSATPGTPAYIGAPGWKEYMAQKMLNETIRGQHTERLMIVDEVPHFTKPDIQRIRKALLRRGHTVTFI